MIELPPLSTESWITDEHGNKIPLYHGDDVEARERILMARIAELEEDNITYYLALKDIADHTDYDIDSRAHDALAARGKE